MDLETRNDGVLRQWCWIEHPRVGDHFLKLEKIFLAQLTPPKFVQRFQPEKREPHFLFQERFDRRRDRDSTFRARPQQIVDLWNVWQIEQLKEAINRAAISWFVIFCGDSAPIQR